MRRFFPYISAPHKRWQRRARLLLLLFLMVAFFYFWHTPEMDEFSGRKVLSAEEGQEDEPAIKDMVGEQIKYDVYMGKVKIGHAKYHHQDKLMYEGKEAHLITFDTKALRFRDRETIYCDRETFLPIVVERKVSQLIRPEKIKEEYDQENFLINITKKRFTTEKRTMKSDEPIHNSILLPYLVRNAKSLKVGSSFDVNLPQRKYKIILSAIEEIEIPAGKFEAYYFESEPKQIRIWVSADENKVPLKLEGTGGVLGYKLLMREYLSPEQAIEKGN